MIVENMKTALLEAKFVPVHVKRLSMFRDTQTYDQTPWPRLAL